MLLKNYLRVFTLFLAIIEQTSCNNNQFSDDELVRIAPPVAPSVAHIPIEEIRKNWPTQFCTKANSLSEVVCHQSPQLGAFSIHGASGMSNTSIWLVGENGAIWHSNGKPYDFRLAYQEADITINAVYAYDDISAWAVGVSSQNEGVILVWDGMKWKPYEGSCLNDLNKKCSADEIRHQLAGITFHGVHGSLLGPVWMVGSNGAIYQSLGIENLQPISGVKVQDNLQGVFVLDQSHVYVVGENGLIVQWKDGVFTSPKLSASESFTSVWGSQPNDIWVTSKTGTILHFDGSSWSMNAKVSPLHSIWGNSSSDIWAVGAFGALIHWDGNKWSPFVLADAMQNELNWVMGRSSNDVWVVGDNGIAFHFDGINWTNMSQQTIWDIKSLLDNVLAIGKGGTVYKWEHPQNVFSFPTWNPVDPGVGFNSVPWAYINSVAGSELGNVWAVGQAGTVVPHSVTLRWNGKNWIYYESGITENLNGVWTSGADNALAVGNHGVILWWNGSKWEQSIGGGTENLYSIWGSASNDVWVAGDKGYLVYWNGSYWIRFSSNTMNSLRIIWGSESSDVWMAGESGTILHFDGTNWKPILSGTNQMLNHIWIDEYSNQVVIANDQGTTLLIKRKTK